jgi:DNA invertase Pin-like site-specific DNA recombinase
VTAVPSSRTDNSAPVQAGIYCRISLAGTGDTTKTDDQEGICRDLAGRLGWNVVDIYTDGSKSAWQPNRKRREWDRMVGDIEAGRINGIVVYHGDRLLRTQEDLLTLIKLARTRGIQLASPVGTRDIGNYDDQFILEIEASMAKRESANTSRRRKAQYERWRREGRVRPGGRGGRAFGFATDGVTLVEAECEVIREMAERLLSGETVGSVARGMSARGARTPAGGEFTHSTVKKMLQRERYAGLMPDGESKAAWEPVLDRETWERVRLVLSAKAGEFSYASNARRHLLSGIAVCVCGAKLQVNPSKGGTATGYACRDGCRKVYRSVTHLDAYVVTRVIARLSNPLNPEGRAMPVDHAAEWAVLERERAETAAKLTDYRQSAGMLSVYAARMEGIDARMGELRELAAGSGRARLLERYQGITRAEWDGMALDVRRALVAATFSVTVLPASGRGPGFRPEDVRVVPLS